MLLRAAEIFNQSARSNIHAEGKLDGDGPAARYIYLRQLRPIDRDMLRRHLDDGPHLGVYLIRGTNATRLAVLDLDDHHGDLPVQKMQEAGKTLVHAAAQMGLVPWPVRSGGGSGIHICFRWDEDQSAADVRDALQTLVAAFGFAEGTDGGIANGKVEIFPKQDSIEPDGYGNLIAVPFGRASVPLDLDMLPRAEPIEWAASPPVAPRKADLETVNVRDDRKLDKAVLRDALKQILPNAYDTWIRVGLALKHDLGDEGFSLWNSWSAASKEKYKGKSKTRRDWDRFKPRPDGVRVGTIFHLAKEAGWKGQPKAVEISEGRTYVVSNGALTYLNAQADGTVVPVKLCNFAAWIGEDVTHDDGQDRRREWTLTAQCDDGTKLPSATLAVEDMKNNWWIGVFGAAAIVKPGYAQHLMPAMQTVSAPVPSRTIYAHLGWRHLDGRWLYLHGGGAIGKDGPVEGYEVAPGGKMVNYVLPEVRDLIAAVRASLDMEQLGGIGILMLAAVYRAPLGEFAPIINAVFIEGTTGSYKSAITGVALAHWGAHWDGKQFPANWSSTANALEKQAFIAKDALLVIDDFKPAGTSHEAEKMHLTAEKLFRSAGNLGGRDRMNADTTIRDSYHPRGLVVATGEDVPKGQSLRARIMIARIRKQDVNLDILSKLQRYAAQGLLAEAMAGYVRWLAAVGADKWREKCAGYMIDQRAKLAAEGDHARTAGNVASMMIGIEALAHFAQHIGAIDETESKHLVERARKSLLDLAAAQGEEQAEEDPALRFVRLIGEGLAAGRCHLTNKRGGEPQQGGEPAEYLAACGWRQEKRHGPEGVEYTNWRPMGDRIGFIENDDVWLPGALAFAAAERLSKDQNRSLGVTEATLGKKLAEMGYVEAKKNDQGKMQARQESVRADGHPQKAWKLRTIDVLRRDDPPPVIDFGDHAGLPVTRVTGGRVAGYGIC
ncbi:MAG TPA: PriCT-2 domain-containing protein [Stellaceae bacterium]|jgi:hypothetical protein|nr:PriCT-2 domain-containing protein [Stellaceae bacterium]